MSTIGDLLELQQNYLRISSQIEGQIEANDRFRAQFGAGSAADIWSRARHVMGEYRHRQADFTPAHMVKGSFVPGEEFPNVGYTIVPSCTLCQNQAAMHGIPFPVMSQEMVKFGNYLRGMRDDFSYLKGLQKRRDDLKSKLDQLVLRLRLPQFNIQSDGSGAISETGELRDLYISGHLLFYRGWYVDYIPSNEIPIIPGTAVDDVEIKYTINGMIARTPLRKARILFNEIERLVLYTLDGRQWRWVHQ